MCKIIKFLGSVSQKMEGDKRNKTGHKINGY